MNKNYLLVLLLLTCFSNLFGQADIVLPSRDSNAVIPILEKIRVGQKITSVLKVLGNPDDNIGSGINIWTFKLSDETIILMGSVDGEKITYIYHSDKDLKEKKRISKDPKK